MKKSTAKAGLVVKSGLKGGQIATNHNRTVSGLKMRARVKADGTARAGLIVKSGLKGGVIASNHNRTRSGLKVRTGVKAGAIATNHNRAALIFPGA